MKVVEKFISINGEGTRAGELAVFLRFHGCNLNCSYCDTKWANAVDCPYETFSPETLTEYVLSTGVKNVTLTGGEPLLQEEIKHLVKLLLHQWDMSVEIETNGAVDIGGFADEERPIFTMDYKLPYSGCEQKMCVENFGKLRKEDTVKFVVGSRQDLERAREIMEAYELTKKCHVYLSPVFGNVDPKDMVDYMIQHHMNDVRLQIQMHKVIWEPNARGV